MGLKRGDVIVVAFQGDLGKPRPAVVVETDLLAPMETVLVCPGTTHLVENSPNRRLLVMPETANGLREPTQFQADKVSMTRRAKCGPVIGRLDAQTMAELNSRLAIVLGLVD